MQRDYRALAAPSAGVAVRSSATTEDLPDLSFAGQQDTFLNIVGEEQLARAVVDCWSSLWTARAFGYRERNAIPPEQAALAVVVQRIVASEITTPTQKWSGQIRKPKSCVPWPCSSH